MWPHSNGLVTRPETVWLLPQQPYCDSIRLCGVFLQLTSYIFYIFCRSYIAQGSLRQNIAYPLICHNALLANTTDPGNDFFVHSTVLSDCRAVALLESVGLTHLLSSLSVDGSRSVNGGNDSSSAILDNAELPWTDMLSLGNNKYTANFICVPACPLKSALIFLIKKTIFL